MEARLLILMLDIDIASLALVIQDLTKYLLQIF